MSELALPAIPASHNLEELPLSFNHPLSFNSYFQMTHWCYLDFLNRSSNCFWSGDKSTAGLSYFPFLSLPLRYISSYCAWNLFVHCGLIVVNLCFFVYCCNFLCFIDGICICIVFVVHLNLQLPTNDCSNFPNFRNSKKMLIHSVKYNYMCFYPFDPTKIRKIEKSHHKQKMGFVQGVDWSEISSNTTVVKRLDLRENLSIPRILR